MNVHTLHSHQQQTYFARNKQFPELYNTESELTPCVKSDRSPASSISSISASVTALLFANIKVEFSINQFHAQIQLLRKN